MPVLAPGDFSDELVEWFARSDARIAEDPRRWPGAFAVLDGGEITYVFERGEDGWITVSRSDRGGDLEWTFRAPRHEVVDRFLANECGPAARFLAGLTSAVRVPFRPDELADGAVLERVSDGPLGGVERLIVDGVVIGEFGFGPSGPLAHGDAVRASHYATAPIAHIVESYLAADGGPLFGVR